MGIKERDVGYLVLQGYLDSPPKKDEFCFHSHNYLKIGQKVWKCSEHPDPGSRQTQLRSTTAQGLSGLEQGRLCKTPKLDLADSLHHKSHLKGQSCYF